MVVAREYRGMEKYAEAVAAYERAVELQPLYLFLLVELGQLYQRMGQSKKSADALLRYERRLYAAANEVTSSETAPVDRANIIDAFSLIEDDKVTMTLVAVLQKDDEPTLRARAARALSEVRATSARAALKAASETDPADTVRVAAREAFAALPDQDVPEDTGAPTFVDDPSQLGK